MWDGNQAVSKRKQADMMHWCGTMFAPITFESIIEQEAPPCDH
jgi:hypothetical protein